MHLKIIIFDLGNVILTNDWHHDYSEQYDTYSDSFGISYDDMERGWKAAWPQFHIGQITEEEFWAKFLRTAGAKNIDIELAKKLWRRYQKPIENMLDFLFKLKQHYKLAALANISKEWLDYKREKYNLDSYFNVIVSSGYSGIAKPDRRIYELALQKLGVRPEECLFIDDSEKNVAIAQKLGIPTVIFQGQKDIESKFRKLGILF